MRVLICGDRNWTDKRMIHDALEEAVYVNVVIEGEAKGADTLARIAAEELHLIVMPFPANWKLYGRAAGPRRNADMLKIGKPDQVWAFHDDLANSKGTANMVAQAQRAGIPVRLFSHEEDVHGR